MGVEKGPGPELKETASEQEKIEDRYYRSMAKGLAEILEAKAQGASDEELRESFSKLLDSMNWAVGVGEKLGYRKGPQAIIGYLGQECFGDNPWEFVTNPTKIERSASAEMPVPFTDLDYDFDRFKESE